MENTMTLNKKSNYSRSIHEVDYNYLSTETISDLLKYHLTNAKPLDSSTLYFQEDKTVNFEYLFDIDKMRYMNEKESEILYSIREKKHRSITFKVK